MLSRASCPRGGSGHTGTQRSAQPPGGPDDSRAHRTHHTLGVPTPALPEDPTGGRGDEEAPESRAGPLPTPRPSSMLTGQGGTRSPPRPPLC